MSRILEEKQRLIAEILQERVQNHYFTPCSASGGHFYYEPSASGGSFLNLRFYALSQLLGARGRLRSNCGRGEQRRPQAGAQRGAAGRPEPGSRPHNHRQQQPQGERQLMRKNGGNLNKRKRRHSTKKTGNLLRYLKELSSEMDPAASRFIR